MKGRTQAVLQALCITQIPQVFHWFDLPHKIKITVRKESLRIIYLSLGGWETPPLGGEGQVRNVLPLPSAWNCSADNGEQKLPTATHGRVSAVKKKQMRKKKFGLDESITHENRSLKLYLGIGA